MLTKYFSIFSITILALSNLSCNITPKENRPNILFIMGDDHTTNAISSYGSIFSEYAKTVNIDRLAEEGVRFENCFTTNSICSPSRATILTGKYSNKNGVYCLNQHFDSTQSTSATILNKAGYQTAVFGKWHLSSRPTGFNEYKVLKKQGRYKNPQFIENGVDSLVEYNGWSTDIIADMTTNFIKERDDEKPFFVMCHFKATHDPWASRPPYDTLWQNIKIPEPDNLFDEYEDRSEAAKRTTLKLEYMNQGTYPHKRLDNADELEQRSFIYQQYIKDFLRCGKVLDENVGRIIQFLKKENLLENTIIIYTADHGHFLGEHGFFSKRFMYEESMKMPLIIRYPKLFELGKVVDELVINADFAPTILDIAGETIPNDMQGKSIIPLLISDVEKNWRDAVYYRYWQHIKHRDVAAHYGIRTKDSKLIFYYGLPLGMTEFEATAPEWEFFDLLKDPHEMNNIYNDETSKKAIEKLKKKMKSLKKEFGDEDSNFPELNKISQNYYSE